jgi:hypothetical protein
LQQGKDALVNPVLSTGSDISFDFTVGYLLADGALDFRGPFVQGPRGARFVYINSGGLADQANSGWRRRAKIALGGISSDLINALNAQPGQVLCTHIAGKAKDGGPPAASVPLLKSWFILSK